MTSMSTKDDVPAAPIAGGNSAGKQQCLQVPYAPNSVYSTDSLAVLLAWMNITGQQASDVTSTIHDVVQNTLVAAVSAISTVSTTMASAPLTPEPTPVPAPTSAVTISPATSGVTAPPVSVHAPLDVVPTPTADVPPAAADVLPTAADVPPPAAAVPPSAAAVFTQTLNNVTYNVPAADATGPFYWVTRGRRIGIFSTW